MKRLNFKDTNTAPVMKRPNFIIHKNFTLDSLNPSILVNYQLIEANTGKNTDMNIDTNTDTNTVPVMRRSNFIIHRNFTLDSLNPSILVNSQLTEANTDTNTDINTDTKYKVRPVLGVRLQAFLLLAVPPASVSPPDHHCCVSFCISVFLCIYR